MAGRGGSAGQHADAAAPIAAPHSGHLDLGVLGDPAPGAGAAGGGRRAARGKPTPGPLLSERWLPAAQQRPDDEVPPAYALPTPAPPPQRAEDTAGSIPMIQVTCDEPDSPGAGAPAGLNQSPSFGAAAPPPPGPPPPDADPPPRWPPPPPPGTVGGVGDGRIFEEEPDWPLARDYRRGPMVDEARRQSNSKLPLVALGILGTFLVGFVLLAALSTGPGFDLVALHAGERCANIAALRADPATLLFADGWEGVEQQMAKAHPSQLDAYKPGGAAWKQLVRRCRDVPVTAGIITIAGALLALVVTAALVRVVFSMPLGLNAQLRDFDSFQQESAAALRHVALFRRCAQRMCQVHDQVRNGSQAFLVAAFKWLAPSGIVLALLCIAADAYGDGWRKCVCCIISIITCFFAAWLGVAIATATNIRTAFAAARGLNQGLRLAFNAGMVMATAIAGVGLLLLIVMFFAFRDTGVLSGAALGASWVAVFLSFAGGIFTKAADVGAAVVCRAEDFGEEVPTNAAAVAVFAGDNVHGVAGAGTDLLQSYLMVLIAAVHFGPAPFGPDGAALPLYLSATGTFASVLGCFSFCVDTTDAPPSADPVSEIRWRRDVQRRATRGLRISVALAAVLSISISAAVSIVVLGAADGWRCFVSFAVGAAAGLACSLGVFTEFATSHEHRPAQSIAEMALHGAPTVVVKGLSVGMLSSAPNLLFIFVIIIVATMVGDASERRGAGEYCVALAGVGMMSTLVINMTGIAFAAVTDNAGGLGRVCISRAHAAVRGRTDALDALGNHTAASGRGFAASAAAIAAYVTYLVFVQEVLSYTYEADRVPGANPGAVAADNVRKWAGDEVFFRTDAALAPGYALNGLDQRFVAGLLLGGGVPFVVAALAMDAVGDAAADVGMRVRREIGSLAEAETRDAVLSGAALPDTRACVEVCTNAALRRTVLPALIAALIPLVAGLAGGPLMLCGTLLGGLAAALLLGTSLTNAGAAWENARLYVEQERLTTHDDDAGATLRLVSAPQTGDPDRDDLWYWVRDDPLQPREMWEVKHGRDGAAIDGRVVRDNVAVGDVVGDPLKDAAGPGVGVMLKFMACVAVCAAPAVKAACNRDNVWNSHCFTRG